MCSLKLSELAAPEALDVLRGAVADVAERSFFMAADPWDDEPLPDPLSESDAWLVATVLFKEAGCSGVASCALPQTLARVLFDAFNGRDPLDPAPDFAEICDLVGEFANMVCGAWLTRTVHGPAFVLSRPIVRLATRHTALDPHNGSRVMMNVDGQPLVVVMTTA